VNTHLTLFVYAGMIRVTLILLLLFCSYENSYTQYYGSSFNDRGISFCQSDKYFFLTGTTRGFGEGSEDIWFIKVNDELQVEFHVEWGGPHYDIASEIIATSDQNYLITGYSWDAPGSRTTVVLAKFDSAGNNIWNSYFGDEHDDHVFSVLETADYGYLITGTNRAQGKEGAVFLIKTDINGVLEWQNFYDTPTKDVGMDVVECDDSSILILAAANSFVGKIASSSEYGTYEASKIMMIKTDNNGNEIWRKFYGGDKHDFANKIVPDGNNCYYFIGSSLNNSNGSFDITLHKIDNSGNIIWRKNYGGRGYEYGNDLDIEPTGDLLLTGTSSSYSAGENPDIYVVRIDQNGNEIWSKTYGGTYSDYGNSGQFLSDGNIAILGNSRSKDGDDSDIFFIKLSASGEMIKGLNNELTVSVFKPVIYPNPTYTYINIYVNNDIDNQSIEFILYDINGKLLKLMNYHGQFKTIYFDPQLSRGAYIYIIKTGKNVYKGKIIIN